MQTYEQLKIEEQVEVYNVAFTFLHDNADHVHNLFDRRTPRIAPSGTDMFYPELWKGIHWAWFLKIEADWLIKSKVPPATEFDKPWSER